MLDRIERAYEKWHQPGGLRESVDQFTGLVNGISAHSFWVAVAYTKKRVQKILRGAKRTGDVVVTL